MKVKKYGVYVKKERADILWTIWTSQREDLIKTSPQHIILKSVKRNVKSIRDKY